MMANIFINQNLRNSLIPILKNFKLPETKKDQNFDQNNKIDFSNNKDSNSNPKKKFNPKLLRKRYPKGKHGYHLEFYAKEFQGSPKYLHIHIVFKNSDETLFKIKVPQVEEVKQKRPIDKEIKRKMKSWIKDELDNIMNEIKGRLEQENLKISETKNENGDYDVIEK